MQDTYGKQEQFYIENRQKAFEIFASEHAEYVNLYDEVLSRKNGSDHRSAIGITLLLRAAVYTNTAYDLTLEGHIDEARVILRSPVELMLLSFLVLYSDEVWKRWRECYALRKQHTNDAGKVNISKIKNNRFDIDKLIKAAGTPFNSVPLFANLKRLRGELSGRGSHENLYNIVPRIDEGDGKTTIYIGNAADSSNDRMENAIKDVIKLMKLINELSKSVASG